MEAEQNIIITNETGLHARPASKFVQKAGSFKSNVVLISVKKVEVKLC